MTVLLIVQAIFLVWIIVELVLLRRNRIAFEELIMKWVDLCQNLYEKSAGHNKKLSDSVTDLTKTLQSALAIKNDVKVLEGTVKELQGVSKIIRAGALKELKDVEEGIKKIKNQLRQEK